MNIRFKATKILSPMDSFKLGDTLPNDINLHDVTLYGSLIGVYDNSPHTDEGIVIVSDTELVLVNSDQAISILYEDIVDVIGPKTKTCNELLTLELKSGHDVLVPIKNGKERTKDIYEFQRFLMRVVSNKWYVSKNSHEEAIV